MQKSVLFNKDARDKILSGVRQITKAVSVTMGASGKCVLVGNSVYGADGLVALPSIVTKDGFTVTKHFELSDPIEQRGAMLIKEAAEKTVQQAGDATTCTVVLAGAMIEEGMKLVNEGANSQELKRGIESAADIVVKELKEMSVQVSGDNNKIFQVATVSANNDKEIGRYIADAYKIIGDDGVIDIEASNGLNTVVKTEDGFKFDNGWISPLFVTNKAKETCEFNDAMVLLYDKSIKHHTQIERALQISINEGKQLLIICEDADGEGLAMLAMNNLQQRIRVCIVKSPEFGDLRRERMEDIAILTGATYMSDLSGLDIKEIELAHFGSAKKVTVSKDETIIIGGNSDLSKVTELVNDLKMNLAEAKTEDEKYPIEKRIARLTGGIAVIQVGAATQSELGEKLDRYDDAVRSTKAAISEGYLAGGGTAFVRISAKHASAFTESDFEKGQQLVYAAMNKPLSQIVENSGADHQRILERVYVKTGNEGYNVKSGKVEDLIQAGIIDSTKALRCALINAASVSGVALTSECLIVCVS